MPPQPDLKVGPYKIFINGEWTDPDSGESFISINPATEAPITQVAEGNAKDVDRAVAAARSALEGPWSRMSPADRGRLLWKLADLLEKQIDEFASLETIDTGKTFHESRKGEFPVSIQALRYFAGWATQHSGRTMPTPSGYFLYTLREPVGVIAAITPWNFPLLLALWKIAPALATGNTVVHKPASLAPLTALRFADLCREAGLPPGVLNVVPGPGSTAGQALVDHPGVDKISFTGETETGRGIMRSAAGTLKRVSLELGGKSPNIVFEDADLDAAAKGSFNAIFYNKGEVCCAGSRLFVDRKVQGELMERILARVKKAAPGDPFDKGTRMGPVISEGQLQRVQGYIESGREEGASLAAGGNRLDRKGYFLQPTVFTGVKNDMRIAREEIFGPVLSVLSFESFEEAITKSNDTFYGLAAGIWTRDIKRAHRAARLIRAGTVWINQYNVFDVGAPFGGFKHSGFGRELGEGALDLYTETKSVFVDLT